MPKTSILTVTCDRPAYLVEAIESVRQQTDPNWEHVILDNGSTNPEVDPILRAWQETAPHVRLFPRRRSAAEREHRKLSAAEAWNTLLALTEGEFVTILDDDNRKDATFVERMTQPMRADPSLEATSCGWRWIDAGGAPTCGPNGEAHCAWNLATNPRWLWQSNTVDSNAWVFRRVPFLQKVGGFDPSLTTCEDWDLTITVLRKLRVIHLPEILFDYRLHPESASAQRGDDVGMIRDREVIRRRHFPDGTHRL